MSRSSTIWRGEVNLKRLNETSRGTMIDHLGIVYTEVGSDFLRGTMAVDERTTQPFGLLHGGASVTLAETLGSIAANLCVDQSRRMCVGLDISANYVRKATGGIVTGTARPVHLGGRTQVWEIRIENEESRLLSLVRLTVIVLERPTD